MESQIKHIQIIRSSRLLEAMLVTRCLVYPRIRCIDELIEPFRFLAEKHKTLISMLSALPHSSMPFGEFLLLFDERHDIDSYFDSIRKLNDAQFFYSLLGGEYDETLVRACMDGTNSATKKLNALRNSISKLSFDLFTCRTELTDLYEALLQDVIAEPFFRHCIENNSQAMKEEIQSIEDIFTYRHPLSYAQEKMGKNFWFISDWETHEVIPSVFTSPNSFRFMDGKRQILVTSLLEQPGDEQARLHDLQQTMKTIGDPTRVAILKMLCHRPMYGKHIAEELNLSTATVSHHIEILTKAGLLHLERDRQFKYFSTNLRRFDQLLKEFRIQMRL